MTVVGLVGLLAIIVSVTFREQWMHTVMALPLLSVTVKQKLLELIKQFLRGLETLHHSKRISSFVLFTIIIWTMDGFGTIFLAKVIHLKFSLLQAWLLLAALGLSSAIPSTPGYVGVYQFVAVIVLKPFGISSAAALAFVLFLQIMNFITVGVWGILAILHRSPLKRGVL
jgi:uncharacterized membrane protein YbhN (UPF0104 family)